MHRDERQHKPDNDIMENNDEHEGRDSGCDTASCYALIFCYMSTDGQWEEDYIIMSLVLTILKEYALNVSSPKLGTILVNSHEEGRKYSDYLIIQPKKLLA